MPLQWFGLNQVRAVFGLELVITLAALGKIIEIDHSSLKSTNFLCLRLTTCDLLRNLTTDRVILTPNHIK